MAHAPGTVHVPAFLSPEFWLGHLGTRRSFLKVACMRLSRWYVVSGLEVLDKQVTTTFNQVGPRLAANQPHASTEFADGSLGRLITTSS